MEPVDRVAQQIVVFSERAFGDLDVEHGGLHVIALHDGDCLLDDVAELHIVAGEVYVDRDQGASLAHAIMVVHADELYDFQVEFMDEAQFFQHGNEVCGRYEAVIGVDPAGKRLVIADVPADGADDGLIVYLDMPLL